MGLAHNLDNFIEERLADQSLVKRDAVQSLEALSLKLSALFPNHESTRIFLRGMIGSGKSTLLNQFLGISESEVFSSDDVKMRLGGDLAHHESVAFSDALSKIGLNHSIDVKTNIRERNNEAILFPKGGQDHIVLDIWIDRDIVSLRLAGRAERGGRLPTSAEIEEGCNLAMKNRIPIVQAALENRQIEWRLFDNSGSQMVEVAFIQDQILTVKDPSRLAEILIKDDRLANILLPVLGSS